MLTVLHVAKELLQRFGRYKQKHETFREDQPSDQSNDHRQCAARPDIVPEYHREAHCQANYGVDKHNWPIGNRGLDRCAASQQQGNDEQASE